MATVYKVATNELPDGRVAVAWASSDGGARQARRALAEEHGLQPLKEVTYEAIDIPTSKGGIIDWLNTNVRMLVK